MKADNPRVYPFADCTALPTALKKWRSGRNLKIETAARQLGVSAATWGHWETGLRFPSGHNLKMLSFYTQIPIWRLVCPLGLECPRETREAYALASNPLK